MVPDRCPTTITRETATALFARVDRKSADSLRGSDVNLQRVPGVRRKTPWCAASRQAIPGLRDQLLTSRSATRLSAPCRSRAVSVWLFEQIHVTDGVKLPRHV